MTKAQADAFDVELGQRLRALRLTKGLSQQELGEPIGISFQQIQKYERGVNRISVNRLFQLAAQLGYSPLTILQGHSAYHEPAREWQHIEPTREHASLLKYFHAIAEDRHRKLVINISKALSRLTDSPLADARQ